MGAGFVSKDIVMRRTARRSSCSALALWLAAGPAFADLTAQEVWDGVESAMLGFGYSVDATETPSGDGLDVTDVLMRFTAPEDNTTVALSVSEIDLVENGDGSVSMTFPASIPITIAAAPEDEDSVDMTLDYANDGLEIVVSGVPGNMTYTYSATQLTVTLAELVVNGTPVGRDAARFEFTMDDVSGSTVTATAEGDTQITQNVQAGTARYDVAFNDPESDDVALISGAMGALYVSSATNLPEDFDPNDPESFASGNFAASGALGYENGTMQFSVVESAGTTTGDTETGSVKVEFAIDGSALRYDVEATDQSIALTGPELPIPVDLSMAGSAFNITMPIAKAEDPQDMAFGLTFRGFEMSDLLWNMVDPAAALPRDPATIALDLTGQVTPFVNLFDPTEMARVESTGQAPGELNALTLNDLTIEAAGAKLGGTGSFTFDNTDLETFDGMPRPIGSVNLTLDGANALIDKLIAMGLLTDEDAMGARMMMSMFAVPGEGEDSLKSSLTINEQGHVLANGMRIQ